MTSTTPDDVRNRLTECFQAVFADLDDAAVHTASTDTTSDWDSLASISLIAVIEEEFDIELPEDDIPGMTSFDTAASVVEKVLTQ